ncbi:MAG: hypothetical protein N2246_06130 [Candidatus Sumerlaeia bacterium]|nr:hypothetical protein [Candidatus Sumerlaeia bacterium]
MNINAPRNFPYSLQLTPQEKTDLFLWYLILMVVVIFSILAVIILKHLLKRRDSRTTQLALDLDALEKMRKTGLLYPEEEERARAAIKKYLAQHLEQSMAGATKSNSSLSPEHSAVGTPQLSGGSMPDKRVSSSPQTAGQPASSKPSTQSKAIDVEDLHRRGIITDEEYQQLRAFFEKKH